MGKLEADGVRKSSLEVAPTTLATFSSCDGVTSAFELDLYRPTVNLNRPAKYLGQRSFRSQVIFRTRRHTHPRTHTHTHTSIALFGPLSGR